MKTHRISRNTEAPDGRKTIVARGRAGISRRALFAPDLVLTGRRFRRANRLTRTEAGLLDVFVRRPDGTAVRPTVTIDLDERTRMVTGWEVIT